MTPRRSVNLSVLDTSPIVEGSDARQALRNTIGLAQLTDGLGYHRYWVPEHHSMRGVASTDPAVLAGQLASATQQIRVGAGGVLLPNHPPLLVAERFGMLEALHSGRIDLGLGRAPGGPSRAANAIRSYSDRTSHSFIEQIREVLGYFHPPDEWLVRAVSGTENRPPVWILGSSSTSAEIAATLGLPYAFAHHLKPSNAAEALRTYRANFQPSPHLAVPQTLVSISVITADTDKYAAWLAGSENLKSVSRHHGRSILLPSPGDAAAYTYTSEDRELLTSRATTFVGAPDTVRDQLVNLLDETETTELMIRTLVHEHDARRRSYELVSSLL